MEFWFIPKSLFSKNGGASQFANQIPLFRPLWPGEVVKSWCRVVLLSWWSWVLSERFDKTEISKFSSQRIPLDCTWTMHVNCCHIATEITDNRKIITILQKFEWDFTDTSTVEISNIPKTLRRLQRFHAPGFLKLDRDSKYANEILEII